MFKVKIYQTEHLLQYCPICGAEPWMNDSSDDDLDGIPPSTYTWYFHVSCTKCGLKAPGTTAKSAGRDTAVQDAVDIWNALRWERVK